MHIVLGLERFVAVPIADAFTHRVSAVEKLHEAHAAFEQPPGEQTIAREAGFNLVGIINAVERFGGRAFSGKSFTSTARNCILAANS